MRRLVRIGTNDCRGVTGIGPDSAGCWAETKPLWLKEQGPQTESLSQETWAKGEEQNLQRVLERLEVTLSDSRHWEDCFRAWLTNRRRTETGPFPTTRET